MSAKGTIGKSIVLLVLIIILTLLGLFWFDYLSVVDLKQFFTPIYRLLGMQPQTSASGGQTFADLDGERIAKRLEALTLRTQEMEKRQEEITKLEAQNMQIAQELDTKRLAQEEREKAFTDSVKKYDERAYNITVNAQKLIGMPPKNAVDIMLAMEDQDVIDILRKVDEIAASTGTNSMVSYWLSLMPAARVAQIQRKMTSKPVGIN